MQFEIKDLTAGNIKQPALYQDCTNPNNIVFVYSFSNGNVRYIFLTGIHTGKESVAAGYDFLVGYKYFNGELYLTN